DVGCGRHFRFDTDPANGVVPPLAEATLPQAKKQNGISGTEGFWGYAKTRLTRFRGLGRSVFYLHLKECEFRYNNRDQDIYKLVMAILKKQPLFEE
ncbi:MAG: hypothetical protein HGA78_12740, partial [Nitrospirales bacterium]|nr:hypothetical protein [Nitrospirales bacterium]